MFTNDNYAFFLLIYNTKFDILKKGNGKRK